MTYRGRVQNGVVVLEGRPDLEDGMIVRVEPMEPARDPSRPPKGSAAAILSCKAQWHGDPGELDRLLAELREMKWAEVRAQQESDDNALPP